MRGIQAAGAAIMMCLALGGVPGAAQDQPQVATGPGNGWVTFIKETCGWRNAGTSGAGDGFSWVRDFPFRCQREFSDPRVSGTYQVAHDHDCFGDQELPCVIWETTEVEGPDGTWTGWTNGTYDADGYQRWIAVLTGSGTYEGLTFILHGQGPAGGKTDQVGFIYEGNPPPTGPVPSAAVEASPSPGA
jgi:hypothetical protein